MQKLRRRRAAHAKELRRRQTHVLACALCRAGACRRLGRCVRSPPRASSSSPLPEAGQRRASMLPSPLFRGPP
eukprot:6186063-Pleurochrysis_carterae.AAC.1